MEKFTYISAIEAVIFKIKHSSKIQSHRYTNLTLTC